MLPNSQEVVQDTRRWRCTVSGVNGNDGDDGAENKADRDRNNIGALHRRQLVLQDQRFQQRIGRRPRMFQQRHRPFYMPLNFEDIFVVQ
jgi:hypothetical protein